MPLQQFKLLDALHRLKEKRMPPSLCDARASLCDISLHGTERKQPFDEELLKTLAELKQLAASDATSEEDKPLYEWYHGHLGGIQAAEAEAARKAEEEPLVADHLAAQQQQQQHQRGLAPSFAGEAEAATSTVAAAAERQVVDKAAMRIGPPPSKQEAGVTLSKYFGNDRSADVAAHQFDTSSSSATAVAQRGGRQTFQINLPKSYPGVLLRKTMNLTDKHARGHVDGEVVKGEVDPTGKWLKLGPESYLPFEVDGTWILHAPSQKPKPPKKETEEKKRLAAEEVARQAEEKRLAEEESARKVKEEAQAKAAVEEARRAEEEKRRLAAEEVARQAEAKRLAEEESARKVEEEAQAKAAAEVARRAEEERVGRGMSAKSLANLAAWNKRQKKADSSTKRSSSGSIKATGSSAKERAGRGMSAQSLANLAAWNKRQKKVPP